MTFLMHSLYSFSTKVDLQLDSLDLPTTEWVLMKWNKVNVLFSLRGGGGGLTFGLHSFRRLSALPAVSKVLACDDRKTGVQREVKV